MEEEVSDTHCQLPSAVKANILDLLNSKWQLTGKSTVKYDTFW